MRTVLFIAAALIPVFVVFVIFIRPLYNINNFSNTSPILFDFDSSVPSLAPGQNTPFDQTKDGVTAHFSSPSIPEVFSVQSYETTFYKLSQFSGKYLVENTAFRNYLYINFSKPLTSINLTFATVDYHGPGEVEIPTNMKLTLYMNSIIVGSVSGRGILSNDNLYPQGILTFAGKQFNMVRIEVSQQIDTYFFVDNIVVTYKSQ